MVEAISSRSFRTVVARSIAVPIVLMLSIAVALAWQVGRLLDVEAWVDHTDLVISRIFEVQKTMLDVETNLRGFQLANDPTYFEAYEHARAELSSSLDTLHTLTADNETQTGRIDSFRARLAEWDRAAANRRTLLTYDRAAQAAAMTGNRATMDDLVRASDAMLAEERRLRDDRSAAARSTARETTIAAVVGTLAVAVLLGWLSRRRLLALSATYAATLRANERQTMMLRAATNGYSAFVDRLASGDFLSTVEPEEGDPELHRLGTNLNVMASMLRTMAARLREAASALGRTTAQILTTAQQLSAGANETSMSISETTAAIDEVTQTAAATKELARVMTDASRRSLEVTRVGREGVAHTAAAMTHVKDTVDSISERVDSLSDQAHAVEQVVTTVSALSDQSNILALSAAIEAARVDEQGRSFASVADEVRVLAEHSKRATRQVRTILEDILKSTSNAVAATGEGRATVRAALETIDEMGSGIEALADILRETADDALQIDAAAGQQANGMVQISQVMRAISQAASQAVLATQQSEEAAREVSSLAEQLHGAVSQYRY